MAKCSECNFAILADHGWSNWTVEGTTVHCSLNLHPGGEFDRWYGEDSRDLFAEKCEAFLNSVGPAEVDCDRESVGEDERDAASWAEYATKYVSAETLRDTLTQPD